MVAAPAANKSTLCSKAGNAGCKRARRPKEGLRFASALVRVISAGKARSLRHAIGKPLSRGKQNLRTWPRASSRFDVLLPSRALHLCGQGARTQSQDDASVARTWSKLVDVISGPDKCVRLRLPTPVNATRTQVFSDRPPMGIVTDVR